MKCGGRKMNMLHTSCHSNCVLELLGGQIETRPFIKSPLHAKQRPVCRIPLSLSLSLSLSVSISLSLSLSLCLSLSLQWAFNWEEVGWKGAEE